MSITNCFVVGCEPEGSEKAKFHSFPADPEQREKWIQFCGQEALPAKKDGVCTRHFRDEDYLPTQRLLGTGREHWRLLKTAVPTQLGPFIVVEYQGTEEEVIAMEIECDDEGLDTTQLQICRMCSAPLQPDDERTTNIFQDTAEGRSRIHKLAEEMFQIVLEDDPNWPGMACGSCVDSFEQIQSFKMQIINTHIMLHNQIVPKPEPPNEQEMPKIIEVESQYDKELLQKIQLFATELHLLDCIQPDCQRTYTSIESFFDHVRSPSMSCKQKSVVCCGRAFSTEATLLEHLKEHVDNDSSACVVCSQEFGGDLQALYAHMHTEHPKEAYPMRCKVCHKVFKESFAYKKHKESHLPMEERKFGCPHCGKRFLNRFGLKTHIYRLHDVQVRVMCENCGRGFADKSNHQKHSKHCTPENPLVAGPRKPGKYQRHVKHKEVSEMREPVNCPVCQEVVDMEDMRVHSLKHVKSSQNNPFCKICLVRISGSSNYITHMDRHLGRRYKCEICPDVEYDNHQGHYLHMKTKHKEVWDKIKNKRGSVKAEGSG